MFWDSWWAYSQGRPPREYMALRWDEGHAEILGVGAGDVAGQATFEAYQMLEAVVMWVDKTTRGKITLIGDAEGVLFGLTKLSAPSPIINDVAKEVALHLAPLGLALSGIHVWGEDNDLADALSRLQDGEAVPRCLALATRRMPPARSRESWKALCH